MDYSSPSIITQTGELLREPLPTKATDLVAHVTALEALRYELADKTYEWQQMLYEKRMQMLWPKEKDKTELDRKTFLDGQTSIIQRDYEFMREIQELIKDRLDLTRLILETSKR